MHRKRSTLVRASHSRRHIGRRPTAATSASLAESEEALLGQSKRSLDEPLRTEMSSLHTAAWRALVGTSQEVSAFAQGLQVPTQAAEGPAQALCTILDRLHLHSGVATANVPRAEMLARVGRVLRDHVDSKQAAPGGAVGDGIVPQRHSQAQRALLKVCDGLAGDTCIHGLYSPLVPEARQDREDPPSVAVRDTSSSMSSMFHPGGVRCPRCSANMERIKRQAFMRMLPGSRHYICWDCNLRYLRVLGKLIALRRRWNVLS